MLIDRKCVLLCLSFAFAFIPTGNFFWSSSFISHIRFLFFVIFGFWCECETCFYFSAFICMFIVGKWIKSFTCKHTHTHWLHTFSGHRSSDWVRNRPFRCFSVNKFRNRRILSLAKYQFFFYRKGKYVCHLDIISYSNISRNFSTKINSGSTTAMLKNYRKIIDNSNSVELHLFQVHWAENTSKYSGMHCNWAKAFQAFYHWIISSSRLLFKSLFTYGNDLLLIFQSSWFHENSREKVVEEINETAMQVCQMVARIRTWQ